MGRLFSYWKGVPFKVVKGLFGLLNICVAASHLPTTRGWTLGQLDPGCSPLSASWPDPVFGVEFPHVFGKIFNPHLSVTWGLDWFGDEKVDPKKTTMFRKKDLTDSTVYIEILMSIWVTRDSDSITVDGRNLALSDWYKRSQELHHHILIS